MIQSTIRTYHRARNLVTRALATETTYKIETDGLLQALGMRNARPVKHYSRSQPSVAQAAVLQKA